MSDYVIAGQKGDVNLQLKIHDAELLRTSCAWLRTDNATHKRSSVKGWLAENHRSTVRSRLVNEPG